MSADLIDLVQRLGQPRVLVVGDLMLDRYVWGDAERISQEAPSSCCTPTGARNASAGPAAWPPCCARWAHASPWPASSAPTPTAAASASCSPTWASITKASLTDADRPSTVKERYIGRAQHRHPQQMLRVDYEDRDARARPTSRRSSVAVDRAPARARPTSSSISDYDKGVCTPGLLAALDRRRPRRTGVRTLADPIRGRDYRKYHGCSAITPNRLEAGLATGRRCRPRDEVLAAAAQLREQLDLEAAIVTLDKDGMALAHRDGRRQVFPTRPRQVYDITGAGDMVLSVLGMALAAGADYDAGDPPGQRRRRPGGREDRRRHGHARRDPPRPAARGAARPARPDKVSAARRCCTASSTAAAGSASASPSPTAASTCCTPATSSTCRKPAPRPTCSSSASTATPASAR